MVVAILISPDVMRFIDFYKYFVQGLWWATAASAVATIIVYTRNGSRYISEYEHRQKQQAGDNE